VLKQNQPLAQQTDHTNISLPQIYKSNKGSFSFPNPRKTYNKTYQKLNISDFKFRKRSTLEQNIKVCDKGCCAKCHLKIADKCEDVLNVTGKNEKNALSGKSPHQGGP
jgi:hypothetical protein